MKTPSKNKGLYDLEKQINALLASLPAGRRPEAPNRSRWQSVAYAARGGFEATDFDGHVDYITLDQAKNLLSAV